MAWDVCHSALEGRKPFGEGKQAAAIKSASQQNCAGFVTNFILSKVSMIMLSGHGRKP